MVRRATSPVSLSDAKGRIKGASIFGFVRWYEQTYGTEQLQRLAARVPEHLRGPLVVDRPVLGILAATWYPAETVHALCDSLAEDHSPAEVAEIAKRGARAVIDQSLRGLYRALFQKIASPARYARYHPKFRSLHYDTGESIVTMPSPTETNITVRGWAAHHPFLCDMNAEALKGIYEAMGCKDVVVRRRTCVSQRAQACSFDIKWAR